MSSDCFDVKVRSVAGTEVVLDVLTGTAGGIDDCFYSKSFALHLLYDALLRAPDRIYGAWDDPERQAACARLDEAHAASALTKELDTNRDWFVDGPWMVANLSRFVTSVELVERRNDLGEDALRAREREVEAEFGNGGSEYAAMRWQKCHNYTIKVVVADAKWAAHLAAGLVFTTAAADWEREAGLTKPA